MILNLAIIAAAALIPIVVGFLWYHPKVFGTMWMEASDLTEEKVKEGNMIIILGVSYLLAFFMGTVINVLVIHQASIASILINEPGFGEAGSKVQTMMDSFMASYGNNFRTFKHGAFHGTMVGIMFVLPLIATGALFEKKSKKYVFVNAGYWTVSIALMGGVICQFS